MIFEKKNDSWLQKPLTAILPKFSIETVIMAIILLLALFSRFYILGERVMSHDEINHVVPSWELATGQGYKHNPVTHGPFQFHAVAFTYFLFGDNDFTSRVPAALFSIAAIALVLFGFKRYLGKYGHLIAGFMLLISPYMLFYGRYTRNEGFIEFIAVLLIYATFRYLDRGDLISLVLLTIAHALNFTVKETAYIYMAILLLFLAFQFLSEVIHEEWQSTRHRNLFIIFTLVTVVLIIGGILLGYINAKLNPTNETGELISQSTHNLGLFSSLTVLLAIIFGMVTVIFLVKGIGLDAIRHLRSFDLLILNGTIVLPLLAAFPIVIAGSLVGQTWTATDYSTAGMIRIAESLLLTGGISVLIGIWWNRQIYLKTMAIFWAIFTVFYTTFFTNGTGFFSGIVGSLGYWLEQQAVNRGTQPLYYYAFLQIPFYEYLALFGALIAVVIGLKHLHLTRIPVAVPLAVVSKPGGEQPAGGSPLPMDSNKKPDDEDHQTDSIKRITETLEIVEKKPDVYHTELLTELDYPEVNESILDLNDTQPSTYDHYRVPVLLMLLFFSIMSLIAYSLAGEKMPWLTVHIALPFILTAAWGFDKLIQQFPWKKITQDKTWLGILILPVFATSFAGTLNSLLGTNPPFEGSELFQLEATSTFLTAIVVLALSTYGLIFFLKTLTLKEVFSFLTIGFSILLAFLTIHTSILSSYINYDTGKEFLVYAHADRGPKDILAQVEEISKRTVGDKQINVAYDNDSLYPYWWYFRDYPNKHWYTDQPTRELLNSPVILASDKNYSKIDSLTKNEYLKFDYLRMVWPIQDYWFLNWERVKYALTNPEMRAAIFQIWLNRDYSDYASIKGRSDLTVATWSPSGSIRMYVRRDIASQIWNYGSLPATAVEPHIDPYEGKIRSILPDRIIGSSGSEPGKFNAPRGVAVAPDGTIYVADSRNHRIQRFSSDGELITTWGSFADILAGEAPAGTFNEPWGIAVAEDGSVFVSDTWNHRVQKFDADGNFISMWGFFGSSESPDGFWGPRGIAIDGDKVFIADTGNKRIAIFDTNGNYITQFGKPGFDLGMLDEPVGLAVGLNGEIYVADTWNQRIQVFMADAGSNAYYPVNTWDIDGWFGQSLDNKPFLATDNQGNVLVVDPEGFRVLKFKPDGAFLYGWGAYSPSSDGFGLPAAIAVDQHNGIWVTDAVNQTLLHFTISDE